MGRTDVEVRFKAETKNVTEGLDRLQKQLETKFKNLSKIENDNVRESVQARLRSQQSLLKHRRQLGMDIKAFHRSEFSDFKAFLANKEREANQHAARMEAAGLRAARGLFAASDKVGPVAALAGASGGRGGGLGGGFLGTPTRNFIGPSTRGLQIGDLPGFNTLLNQMNGHMKELDRLSAMALGAAKRRQAELAAETKKTNAGLRAFASLMKEADRRDFLAGARSHMARYRAEVDKAIERTRVLSMAPLASAGAGMANIFPSGAPQGPLPPPRTRGLGGFFGDISKNVDQTNRLSQAFGSLSGATSLFISLGIYRLFGAGTRIVREAIAAQVEFNKSIAEANSLISGNAATVANLSKQVLELSQVVPRSPADLGQGAYTIFSAGILDTADALSVLEVAGKSAGAGITDVRTAAETIVGVMQAYRFEADQAGRVSDALFQTVKRGILRFEDLHASLGTAVPVAAAFNVRMEEVLAAVQTMTKGGLNATRSTTALRQAFQNITNPSKEALEIAEAYGIELSGQALATKGLLGFMEDFSQKIGLLNPEAQNLVQLMSEGVISFEEAQGALKEMGGAAAATAEIFTSRRGLMAAVLLSGARLGVFREDLDATINSMGSMEAAFKRATNNISDRSKLAANRMAAAFQDIIPVLIKVADGFIKLAGFLEKHRAVIVATISAVTAMGTAWLLFTVGGGVAQGLSTLTRNIIAYGTAVKFVKAGMTDFTVAGRAFRKQFGMMALQIGVAAIAMGFLSSELKETQGITNTTKALDGMTIAMTGLAAAMVTLQVTASVAMAGLAAIGAAAAAFAVLAQQAKDAKTQVDKFVEALRGVEGDIKTVFLDTLAVAAREGADAVAEVVEQLIAANEQLRQLENISKGKPGVFDIGKAPPGTFSGGLSGREASEQRLQEFVDQAVAQAAAAGQAASRTPTGQITTEDAIVTAIENSLAEQFKHTDLAEQSVKELAMLVRNGAELKGSVDKNNRAILTVVGGDVADSEIGGRTLRVQEQILRALGGAPSPVRPFNLKTIFGLEGVDTVISAIAGMADRMTDLSGETQKVVEEFVRLQKLLQAFQLLESLKGTGLLQNVDFEEAMEHAFIRAGFTNSDNPFGRVSTSDVKALIDGIFSLKDAVEKVAVSLEAQFFGEGAGAIINQIVSLAGDMEGLSSETKKVVEEFKRLQQLIAALQFLELLQKFEGPITSTTTTSGGVVDAAAISLQSFFEGVSNQLSNPEFFESNFRLVKDTQTMADILNRRAQAFHEEITRLEAEFAAGTLSMDGIKQLNINKSLLDDTIFLIDQMFRTFQKVASGGSVGSTTTTVTSGGGLGLDFSELIGFVFGQAGFTTGDNPLGALSDENFIKEILTLFFQPDKVAQQVETLAEKAAAVSSAMTDFQGPLEAAKENWATVGTQLTAVGVTLADVNNALSRIAEVQVLNQMLGMLEGFQEIQRVTGVNAIPGLASAIQQTQLAILEQGREFVLDLMTDDPLTLARILSETMNIEQNIDRSNQFNIVFRITGGTDLDSSKAAEFADVVMTEINNRMLTEGV